MIQLIMQLFEYFAGPGEEAAVHNFGITGLSNNFSS